MKTIKLFTVPFLAIVVALNLLAATAATAQTACFKIIKNSGVASNPVAFAANENDATISWGTATEQDVNYYLIERSVNHGNFKHAAVIFSTTAATGNSYTYTDRKAAAEGNEVLYRISTVYNDGTVKQYTAAVNFNGATTMLAKL